MRFTSDVADHPALAGIITFVIGGLMMIMFGDSLYELAIGIIAIIFFGGFGGYAMFARTRGQGKLALLPGGIEIGLPGRSASCHGVISRRWA